MTDKFPGKSDAPSGGAAYPVGFWDHPAVISANNFVHKSLSQWAFNTAIGCSHGCRFCYVPSAATIKLSPKLAPMSVSDPDAQWGQYVFLRTWDEAKFLASLKVAEKTPSVELKADGNRAVIYCSTTDPYQVIYHPDIARRQELAKAGRRLVTRSLELIHAHSTVNVRILTRSPLARLDFDLFKKFGKRLVFGMSLPTLREDLSRVYEPNAPSPQKRLETLYAAKAAGLHVYVAMAPTYPECDEDDLEATIDAIKDLDPVTIFHEPINIRAENITRIRDHAASLDVTLNTEVFSTQAQWATYAMESLRAVESIATRKKLSKPLHLWPDKALGSKSVLQSIKSPKKHMEWLEKQWAKKSAWPK